MQAYIIGRTNDTYQGKKKNFVLFIARRVFEREMSVSSFDDIGVIEGIDIGRIMSSPHGADMLMRDTSREGLIITPRFQDLGGKHAQDLPYFDYIPDVYEGFEEDLFTKPRVIQSSIGLILTSPRIFKNLILVRAIPVFGALKATVMCNDNAFSEPLNVPITNISVIDMALMTYLELRVKIEHNYTGPVHGFVVLVFQGEELGPSPFHARNSTLVTGVSVKGFVSNPVKLSSEAPVFVTALDKDFFNLPGFDMHMPRILEHEMLAAVFRLDASSLLMKMLVQNFRTSMRMNAKLEQDYKACLAKFLKGESTFAEGAFNSLLRKIEEECNVGSAGDIFLKRLDMNMWLEELQTNEDTNSNDLHCVDINCVRRSREYYFEDGTCEYIHASAIGEKIKYCAHMIELKAPGSSENRPSVMVGNVIKLRPVKEDWPKAMEFKPASYQGDRLFQLEGIVTQFKLATETVIAVIFLPKKMSTLFKKSKEQESYNSKYGFEQLRYHVRFEFDRTGFHFVHRAIGQFFESDNNGGKRMQAALHPAQPPMLAHWPGNYLDREKFAEMKHVFASLNKEQLEAVQAISCLQKASRVLGMLMPPYTLYGPPGTGKTTTVVKAIQALLLTNDFISILATAPSDAAADVLCLKLIAAEAEKNSGSTALSSTCIIRLNWWKRVQASVPVALKNYCIYCKNESNGIFNTLHMSELTDPKVVIVATCGAAGMISDGGQFDYVFVDEASQASEAETLVPCTLLRRDSGAIVLAGDPKQLGVPARSPANLLISSMLDRLLSLPAYSSFDHPCKVPYPDNSQFVLSKDSMVLGTYLKRNYRSHIDILDLPSRMFYNSSLVECGKRGEIDSIVNKWRYKNESSSISTSALFVGVSAKHGHENGSASFFNFGEIIEIESILQSLLTSPDIQPKVKTSEICVICAFRAQVLELRRYLRERSLGNVEVGSPEDYQGQEKRIAIVSTVLSSRPRMLKGISESYGLLSHPRKFNVCITRGKALVIVVGNPFCLLGDPSWREYIEQCDSRGGYYGVECLMLRRHQKSLASTGLYGQVERCLGDGHTLFPSNDDELVSDVGTRINFDKSWRFML